MSSGWMVAWTKENLAHRTLNYSETKSRYYRIHWSRNLCTKELFLDWCCCYFRFCSFCSNFQRYETTLLVVLLLLWLLLLPPLLPPSHHHCHCRRRNDDDDEMTMMFVSWDGILCAPSRYEYQPVWLTITHMHVFMQSHIHVIWPSGGEMYTPREFIRTKRVYTANVC